MKSLLCSILFFLAPVFLFAQERELIRLGEESVQSQGHDLRILSIWKAENGHTYVLRGNYRGDATRYTLEVFNKEMKSYAYHPTRFEVGESDKFFFVEAPVLNGIPYLICSKYIAAQKKHLLIAYEYDENGIHSEKGRELFSIPAFNPNNCGKYRMNLSANKHFAAVNVDYPSDKTKNESIQLIRFDAQLEITWKKEYTFETISRANPVNIPLVNDKGDVFVIKKDFNKTNYKFQILCVDGSIGNIIAKPINVNGVFISDIRGGITSEGKLALAGFYSSIGYTEYEGMFYFAFDASGNTVAKHHETLPVEMLAQFIGKKEASKEKASIPGFLLQHLVPTQDGGMIAMAEKTANVTEGEKEKHEYGDLLVMSMDNSGNIRWSQNVSKKQYSINDRALWSSYNYWMHNDTLNILYNKVDLDESISKTGKRKKADEFGEFSFAGTMHVMITPKGQMTSTPLTAMHRKHTLPMAMDPDMVYQDREGAVYFLIEDYVGKIHRLGVLNFFSPSK
jgi:hypothetical protein